MLGDYFKHRSGGYPDRGGRAGGEMAYTLGLGPSAARRGGSSPLLPTILP